MFMNDISILVRRMRVYTEHSLAQHGLGFPEQVVLMYLQGNGPVNQEAIARHYDLDKGAIAKTLGKLEEKGLIVRAVNPENRREKIVEMTREAFQVMEDMKQALTAWNDAVYEGITDEERSVMEDVVARMAQNASEMTEAH